MKTKVQINSYFEIPRSYFNRDELNNKIELITSKAIQVIDYPEPTGDFKENLIYSEKEFASLIGYIIYELNARICSRSNFYIEEIEVDNGNEPCIEVQLNRYNNEPS